MIAIGASPLVPLLSGTDCIASLVPQFASQFTAVRADGQVMSVQPDGSVQWRPAGANGPYELLTVTTQGLLFWPLPDTPYLFAYPR